VYRFVALEAFYRQSSLQATDSQVAPFGGREWAHAKSQG
jgi:hypothetical protein